MNCGSFRNHVFEYLDGSLTGRLQTAAEEHLDACAACREFVAEQRSIAGSLSRTFYDATESLHLPPQTWEQVPAASPGERRSSAVGTKGVRFPSRRLAWSVGLFGSAAVLMAGVLFVVVKAHWPGLIHPETAQTSMSIQLSYPVPAYKFHAGEGFVVDSVSYQTAVICQTVAISRNPRQ